MTTRIRHVNSSLGFNTIELLIVVAILAVVALAGATLAGVADKATGYPDRKQEFQSLGAFIMENLKNAQTCTVALNGNNLNSSNGNGRGNANGNASRRITQAGGRQLWIDNIPNLQTGASMTGVTLDPTSSNAIERQILPRRLEITDLSLRDGILLETVGGNSTYLASVWLAANEIGGMSFKPQMIGNLTLTMDSGGNVTSCQSMPSDALAATCASAAGMGCEWDPNSQPNCRCLRSQMLCTAPGYYPVAFKNGVPDCRPLGGGSCANPDEYLVGVELEKTICAPVPTTCPNGTSTTGAGNPVAGLSSCRCDTAGQTYVTGSGCQAVAAPPAAPFTCDPNCYLGLSQNCLLTGSTTVPGLSCNPADVQNFCDDQCAAAACTGGAGIIMTASPASPAGCYCPTGTTWNTSTSACAPPAAVTCSGGATTTVTAVPASPGCYCPTGQAWNGFACGAPLGPTLWQDLGGALGISAAAVWVGPQCSTIGAVLGQPCSGPDYVCANSFGMGPLASVHGWTCTGIGSSGEQRAAPICSFFNFPANRNTVQPVSTSVCSTGAMYCTGFGANDGICVPPTVLTDPYTPQPPFLMCTSLFVPPPIGTYTTINGSETCTQTSSGLGVKCGTGFKQGPAGMRATTENPQAFIADCVPCAAGSKPPATCL